MREGAGMSCARHLRGRQAVRATRLGAHYPHHRREVVKLNRAVAVYLRQREQTNELSQFIHVDRARGVRYAVRWQRVVFS